MENWEKLKFRDIFQKSWVPKSENQIPKNQNRKAGFPKTMKNEKNHIFFQKTK